MQSDHWARVKEVFTEAIEQSAETRDAFVRAACGDDGLLRDHVLKLITGHDRASSTLSSPLLPPAVEERAPHPPRFAPSTIVADRFRIVRLIARGGMGEVYEAEDGQLRVQVALKTIRKI